MLRVMSQSLSQFVNRQKQTSQKRDRPPECVRVFNLEHGSSTFARLGPVGLAELRRLKSDLCPLGPACACRREMPIDCVGGVRAVEIRYEFFRLYFIVKTR